MPSVLGEFLNLVPEEVHFVDDHQNSDRQQAQGREPVEDVNEHGRDHAAEREEVTHVAPRLSWFGSGRNPERGPGHAPKHVAGPWTDPSSGSDTDEDGKAARAASSTRKVAFSGKLSD